MPETEHDLTRGGSGGAGAARSTITSNKGYVGAQCVYGMQEQGQLVERAAIITQLFNDNTCQLTIFMPTGSDQKLRAGYSESLTNGAWTFPNNPNAPTPRTAA